MAAAPLTPPVIQQNVPVVDPQTGMMTAYFSIWLVQVLTAIITAVNQTSSIVASLQAQQAAILAQNAQIIALAQAISTAQATADAASGSGAKSGNAQGNFTCNSTSTFTHGPVVSLTGVIAGNLTIANTAPSQDNSTGVNALSGVLGNFTGNWRVVEVIGGIDTVVYNSGTYHAERDRDDQGVENILYNLTDVSAVSIARSTTGAIDYRLDFNAPTFDATSVLLYLSVRRA